MAIAFDASAGGISGSSVTTFSYSHTCTGDDRILFVAAFGIATGVDVSGVTYDSVAMTKIGSTRNAQSNVATTLWYLIAPSTGANNVEITIDTSGTIRGSSASYTGAKQSGVPDAEAGDEGSSVTITDTLTTIADNAWTVGAVNGLDQPITPQGTEVKRDEQGTGNNRTLIADMNTAKTPAGSVTMEFDQEGSAGWAIQMASFAPAVDEVAENAPFFGTNF